MKYVGNKIRAHRVSGYRHLVKALGHWAVVTQKVVSETLPPPTKPPKSMFPTAPSWAFVILFVSLKMATRFPESPLLYLLLLLGRERDTVMGGAEVRGRRRSESGGVRWRRPRGSWW